MSTHKNIDRICVVIIVLCLLLTILFMNGQAMGIQAASRSMGYEKTLFDTSRVHTIDIVIEDWDAFIETCESETYSACSVVIDSEAVKNAAIRGKGNTSLSTVKTIGSQRYSFKIEFDHYESGKSYHGLDKLSLNNIIQDNTYMKDYLAYRLMDEFGVDSPLCSFVYVTVNGEDWGLYLAVEGVEDCFLQRNYGRDAGELYKPDSMSFGGGGPGNGKGFNMDDFLNRDTERGDAEENGGGFSFPGFGGGEMPEGFDPSQFGGDMPEGFDPSQFGGDMPEGFDPSQFGGDMPEGFDPSQFGGEMPEGFDLSQLADGGEDSGSGRGERRGGFDFGGIFGGMGGSDVKLLYSDDDPDSYSNIFGNAKTDVSEADQKRLIQALKKLNAYEDIEDVVDVDEVIRYFVVHNYVVNGDSYTGSIIHNYYLHEADGKLSMIPWDYNLAFGTFQGSDATGTVNDPIDTPLSVSNASDRPMWGWILSSEEYTALYHQYFAEFLDTVDITGIIDEAYALIKSYVAKDPTAFCTYEEFETGVETLRAFCELRTESVRGQLEGTIPSTDEGQRADSSSLIDASAITISDMGSMGGGGGGGFGPGGGSSGEKAASDFPGEGFGGGSFPDPGSGSGGFPGGSSGSEQGSGGGMARPGGSGRPSMGGGGFPGGDGAPPAMQGDQPEGSQNGSRTRPEGFAPERDQGQTDADGSGVGTSGRTWLLTAVSAAVLLAGLVIARVYRRRG